MSNDNPVQNEAFTEARKATQFKPGHRPDNSNDGPSPFKPYSVRRQLRLVFEYQFDPDLSKVDDGIAKFLQESEGMMCNGARLAAARAFEKLIKKMPADLLDKMIENAEGKQVQPTQELPPDTPLPTDCVTEEEAAAIHAQYARK